MGFEFSEKPTKANLIPNVTRVVLFWVILQCKRKGGGTLLKYEYFKSVKEQVDLRRKYVLEEDGRWNMKPEESSGYFEGGNFTGGGLES